MNIYNFKIVIISFINYVLKIGWQENQIVLIVKNTKDSKFNKSEWVSEWVSKFMNEI